MAKQKDKKTYKRKVRKVISKTAKSARDEIRFNKRTKHPSYVYERDRSDYKYLGITSSPNYRGKKNIMLEKNPNPKIKKPAYIKTVAEKDNIGKFNKKATGWKLTEKDKEKIKPYKK